MEQHISLSSRILLAPRCAGLCLGQDNSVEVLVRIQAPDSPAGEARTRPPQAVSLADAMNELSNKQASTAADILDVVTRVGPQAKQFGLVGEQVAALGSAMLATGQAPEVVATSLRNMGMF